MKMLRVDDDVHQIITELAEAEDRGLTAYLNRHFRRMDRARKPADIPEFKQEYTAPPVQLTPAIGVDVSPTPKKNNSVATQHDLPQSKLRPEPKYCKAGHLLSPTGRCLQKGCKYA